MEQDLQDIIYLIEKSDLDQTIKELLIRDLQKDGMTDFLREQIIAYCVEGMKDLDERIAKAKAALQQHPS